ncbi:hypothetical protein NDU88_001598 [Pleurodeles waltl]|uniref:Uncharacterized protein n=1 Tax=Pleurodeles waltl TaxID=8319 RepID=A0AAV7VZE8_PLEWA|nr:hypothetical protein NDU88_001598 [Pleurodeles waltl]
MPAAPPAHLTWHCTTENHLELPSVPVELPGPFTGFRQSVAAGSGLAAIPHAPATPITGDKQEIKPLLAAWHAFTTSALEHCAAKVIVLVCGLPIASSLSKVLSYCISGTSYGPQRSCLEQVAVLSTRLQVLAMPPAVGVSTAVGVLPRSPAQCLGNLLLLKQISSVASASQGSWQGGSWLLSLGHSAILKFGHVVSPVKKNDQILVEPQ